MARPPSVNKGIRTNSESIGLTISGCPRPVYELAVDNMKAAGISMSEVLTSLMYRWASIPSKLSAKYELISQLEEEAQNAYEERLTAAREQMHVTMTVNETECKKETDTMNRLLEPIVRSKMRRLHFDSAVGTSAREEHEIAMGDIRFALEGRTRCPTDAEVLHVYNKLKQGA